jgi:hypothetical protein
LVKVLPLAGAPEPRTRGIAPRGVGGGLGEGDGRTTASTNTRTGPSIVEEQAAV